MKQRELAKHRKGQLKSLSVAAAAGAAALALSLPTGLAYADPATPTPAPAPAPGAPENPAPEAPGAPAAETPAPGAPAAETPAPGAPAPEGEAPAPGAPAPAAETPAPGAPAPEGEAPPPEGAAPPAEGDPAAAPAPDPELGRINNAVGGFSFVLPAGWVEGDATRLNYGSALLNKETGPAEPGQPAPTATDTSILLGRLDLKLFAGAEPDNAKAATRLASDMGEFFMPFPGTRINQETVPLEADGLTGSASYYEVKFTDTTKPNGQIWSGVVGDAGTNAPRGERNERWFVVWLGTSNDPIDKDAAVALANSIRPYTPPPAEAAPEGQAPAPADSPVGVPVPVDPATAPEMVPAG